MEMLPGAVQVLIEWLKLLVSTITTFIKRLNGNDDETDASEEGSSN